MCPLGWQNSGDTCYLFIENDANNQETKSEAEATCQGKNGRLLEVETQGENDFIAIGLSTMYNGNNAYLDCSDSGAEASWTCNTAGHYWTVQAGDTYFSKYDAPTGN